MIRRRRALVGCALVLGCLIVAGVIILDQVNRGAIASDQGTRVSFEGSDAPRRAAPTPRSTDTDERAGVGAPATPPVPPRLPPEALAALPEARYDAVIPGLSAETDDPTDPRSGSTVAALGEDAALYADDRVTAVARLAATDFLGEPTVVVPVLSEGGWVRVLTPARQRLPSQAPGVAPAQTAAWVAADVLLSARPIPNRIVVSVAAQTLSILDGSTERASYPVGVGAAGTPTPTGVTGYLQARYLDPAQGQSEHRIQLTSLHATGADEPYGGSDGGLIGMHFSDLAAGAVSHGCIRLGVDALTAVDALPLGTPVTIVP